VHLLGFYYKNDFSVLSTDTVYNIIYSLGAPTYIHIHSGKGPTLILKHKKESKLGYLIRFIHLSSYKKTTLMLPVFQPTFVSNLVKTGQSNL
jgi:hypothetical protein